MRPSICSSRSSAVELAPAAAERNLGQRAEQLLGGLRGAMRIGESVQSVGHRFEFVFQGVDRLGEQLRGTGRFHA